jgi:hypothetical protein
MPITVWPSEAIEQNAALRAQLEKTARKYHDVAQESRVPGHRYWKFENCPAQICVENRGILDGSWEPEK